VSCPKLPPDNVHVAKDLAEVKKGRLLSPVLLIRGRLDANFPLTVADGYHRICASYHLNEDADIPCRIADWPAARPAKPRAPLVVHAGSPAGGDPGPG
jgi:hypothetical protein